MTTRILSVTALIAIASMSTSAALANPKTGSLSGQVRDSHGKPVAGVYIEIMETGEITRADSHGNYTFLGEDPGSETVRASADQYKADTIKVTIPPGTAEELDFVLEARIMHRVVVTKPPKPGATVIVKWYSGPGTRRVYADPQESFPGDLGLHSTARSR